MGLAVDVHSVYERMTAPGRYKLSNPAALLGEVCQRLAVNEATHSAAGVAVLAT
jgi:hypothetical protein